MNNNLSQMVRNGVTEEAVIFSEDDLDIPETSVAKTREATTDPNVIEMTNLAACFNGNIQNFPNIRKPTVSITGVDPTEQLLVTIGTEEGTEKRRIVIFDDAHLIPALNRSAMDMQIYNNGFRIIYDIGNGIFVKSYGVRTGLISVFCNDIDDNLIPYAIVRAKKKDTSIEIVTRNPADIRHKLSEALDVEALQLRYKQSSKAEGLESNQDAINWLLERQATIEDINHHLQIDNVIIDTLA
jgi:hypothetical protein